MIAEIAAAIAQAAEANAGYIKSCAAELGIFDCYSGNKSSRDFAAYLVPRQNHFSLSTILSSGCPAAKRLQFSMRIASHFSRYGVP